MTDELTELKDLAEQNHQNIQALAEALNAQGKLADQANGPKWASLFGLPHAEEEDAAEADQVAAMMEENAANLVAVAEAAGVSEHRLEGSATSPDFSDLFGFSSDEVGQ